ncbi:SbmA/BacA-like family transporter [Escherichia coli]
MEVGVTINAWYAPFYNLIQTALSSPHKVTIEQFYRRSRHLSGDCAESLW